MKTSPGLIIYNRETKCEQPCSSATAEIDIGTTEIIFVSVLVKYVVNYWMYFNETFRKKQLALQLKRILELVQFKMATTANLT